MPKQMPQYIVTEAGEDKWEAGAVVNGEVYSATFMAPTSEEAEASARAYAALINSAFGPSPDGGGGPPG